MDVLDISIKPKITSEYFDVSELASRVLDLEKELERVVYLYQATSDAIAVIDEDLCIRTINRAFNEFVLNVYHHQVELEMSLGDILLEFPEVKESINLACQQALHSKTTASLILENSNVNPNHDHYYCYEVLIDALKTKYHTKNEFIFIIRNMTGLKLEELLRHKQHVELMLASQQSAMKEVALAMAHEINQPLAAIVAYSSASLLKLDDANHKNILSHLLEQISKQANYAGEIVHGMKDLIHKEGFHVEEIDIDKLIEESLAILNYELLDFNLKVELNLTENLSVTLNKTHIMQMILNLSRNSIEALKSISEPNPTLSITAHQMEHNVVVDIRDNGPGVPIEFQDKLFRSYFTTKSQGVGIGLGICTTIVQSHGGTLVLQKHDGIGAWFRFTLPLAKNT
ncbi:MAG: hypothetical protein CK424_06580 [Legionella sp.]|nr:MAG: hypothetical protein CK424_06580 [Legionella sp.]